MTQIPYTNWEEHILHLNLAKNDMEWSDALFSYQKDYKVIGWGVTNIFIFNFYPQLSKLLIMFYLVFKIKTKKIAAWTLFSKKNNFNKW